MRRETVVEKEFVGKRDRRRQTLKRYHNKYYYIINTHLVLSSTHVWTTLRRSRARVRIFPFSLVDAAVVAGFTGHMRRRLRARPRPEVFNRRDPVAGSSITRITRLPDRRPRVAFSCRGGYGRGGATDDYYCPLAPRPWVGGGWRGGWRRIGIFSRRSKCKRVIIIAVYWISMLIASALPLCRLDVILRTNGFWKFSPDVRRF